MSAQSAIPWQRLFRRYLRESSRPFASLLVCLPLLLLYEVGGRLLGREGTTSLIAERLLIELVALVGPLLRWTPALLWVATLVIWHIRRRDRSRTPGFVPLGMLGESLLLTIPLFVLGGFVTQMALAQGAPLGLDSRLLGAVGAGLYEELIFRCYLLLGLAALLKALGLTETPAGLIALLLAAVAFSACHLQPIGGEAWNASLFTVRTVGGLYLGFVFWNRGLGIATCTHVIFDVLSILGSATAG